MKAKGTWLLFLMMLIAAFLAFPANLKGEDLPEDSLHGEELQGENQPEKNTTQEEIAEVKDEIKGLSETLSEIKTDVEKMKKIKISGYIQAQYENHQESEEGLDSKGKPANYDNFLIRRGRVKVEFDATKKSKYVLQIDAAKDKVTLKDAYVELKAADYFKLTFGQFKWPFGYEILQSSSQREMPERAKVIRELFPGERDRGIKFSGEIKKFDYQIGLFNGTGVEDKTFTWQDPDNNKDVVARLGADFGKIRFGLSGYSGEELVVGRAATPGSTTWYDADHDGSIDEGEYKTIDPKPATPDIEYDKERYGTDIQWYFEIPRAGGGTFKAEYIQGKNRGKDVEGWYALFVQNLGKRNAFAFRVDNWDPDTNLDDDELMTYIPAWLFYWDANLKLTFAYEMPREKEGFKVDNNVFTFRIQYKF
ncbi:MAG: porin [Acidobacteriota bacterium]